jgi:hypothetical protein
MRINVYQRHIDRGFGGKGCEMLCPIAIAMSEQLGVKIGVWKDRAWVVTTGESYILPEVAIKRYVRYDNTGMMNPFDFDIDDKLPAVKKEEPKEESKQATA